MSATKKLSSDSDNLINSRIQRKFDLVFSGQGYKKSNEEATLSKPLSTKLHDDSDFGEIEMSSSARKNDATEVPSIDLDFTFEDEVSTNDLDLSQAKNSTSSGKSMLNIAPAAPVENTDGLDFFLNFCDVEDMVPEKISSAATSPAVADKAGMELSGMDLPEASSGGFDLGDDFQTEFAEDTKKTIVVSANTLSNYDLESFKLETTDSDSTSDLMSTEEAKANIESTIKDILRPKNLNSTQEFKLQAVEKTFANAEPSDNFSLDALMDSDDNFTTVVNADSNARSMATGEFSTDPSDFAPVSEEKTRIEMATFDSAPVQQSAAAIAESPRAERTSDEDSIRTHATIRQLREEREELLAQIKMLKTDQRELEQDNLSLKAGLDEAKIEITILRKRHMVELEDIKYRLTISEEKKLMAEEKARQADLRREKLEQKVRIDYNQVKLREKELESKLEMLSMDVDAQVQGRDHKILELRRKIDALEFNMENASIKEQRSNDDKRKLEDKLNKIMKTLRNSIKNIEEDIDQAQEELPNSEKN